MAHKMRPPEFESMQRAKDWLNSEEHREPRKMRHRTARTNMIVGGRHLICKGRV
jgi:uncharacterized protein (DUF1330 family)